MIQMLIIKYMLSLKYVIEQIFNNDRYLVKMILVYQVWHVDIRLLFKELASTQRRYTSKVAWT